MNRQQTKNDLIAFLRSMQPQGDGFDSLGENEPLIGKGLTDSLDLLNVITYLEQQYRIDFNAGNFDPDEFGTLGGILDLIERHASQ